MLGTSLVVYGAATITGLLALVSVVALSWAGGWWIHGGSGRRRIALVIGALLVPLVVAKYLPWLDGILRGGSWWTGEALQARRVPPGLSFATLQAIAYVVDVARRRIEPTAGLARHALFLAFFPQLVAGPIERAEDLRPQLDSPRKVRGATAYVALKLALWGYALKLLCADPLGFASDALLGEAAEVSAAALLLSLALFSCRIYFDFYGYSCIAVAFGQLHGIRLTMNFRHPYGAASLRDFWRRWHVSLSNWLRDYIYRPLGGSRYGTPRMILATLVVFVISGLWHGASGGFLLWGVAHGVLLLSERIWNPGAQPEVSVRSSVARARAAVGSLLTWTVVTILWLPFLSGPTYDIVPLVGRLSEAAFSPVASSYVVFALGLKYSWAIAIAVSGLALDRVVSRWYLGPARPAGRLLAIEVGVCNLLAIGLILFGGFGERTFVYFAF